MLSLDYRVINVPTIPFDLASYCEAHGLNASDIDPNSVDRVYDVAASLNEGQYLVVSHTVEEEEFPNLAGSLAVVEDETQDLDVWADEAQRQRLADRQHLAAVGFTADQISNYETNVTLDTPRQRQWAINSYVACLLQAGLSEFSSVLTSANQELIEWARRMRYSDIGINRLLGDAYAEYLIENLY